MGTAAAGVGREPARAPHAEPARARGRGPARAPRPFPRGGWRRRRARRPSCPAGAVPGSAAVPAGRATARGRRACAARRRPPGPAPARAASPRAPPSPPAATPPVAPPRPGRRRRRIPPRPVPARAQARRRTPPARRPGRPRPGRVPWRAMRRSRRHPPRRRRGRTGSPPPPARAGPLLAQRSTGPADIGVECGPGVRGQVLAPHLVDEPVVGDHAPARDEEGGDQPARPPRRQRLRPAVELEDGTAEHAQHDAHRAGPLHARRMPYPVAHCQRRVSTVSAIGSKVRS